MTSEILKRAAEAVEGVTPERLWCWNFQTKEGGWGKGWGGYARQGNRHPLDERECNTGAEYVRADLMAAAIAERDAEIERLTARAEAAEAMADRLEDIVRDFLYDVGSHRPHGKKALATYAAMKEGR